MPEGEHGEQGGWVCGWGVGGVLQDVWQWSH